MLNLVLWLDLLTMQKDMYVCDNTFQLVVVCNTMVFS